MVASTRKKTRDGRITKESTTQKKTCVVQKCSYNTRSTFARCINLKIMPKKKQEDDKKTNIDKWGCKFLLTVNKPTLTSLLMTVNTNDLPEFTALKEAVEVGENGNLHKHIFVAFRRSIRKSTLINKFKEHGVQVDLVTPGTEATVIDYIGSQDKEVSKGCTIITDYNVTIGDIQLTQGMRSDISTTDMILWDIKEQIDNGATKGELYNMFFPHMVRYGQGVTSYLDFKQREKTADVSQYAVNKTSERFEHESLARDAEARTKAILDLDVFSNN